MKVEFYDQRCPPVTRTKWQLKQLDQIKQAIERMTPEQLLEKYEAAQRDPRTAQFAAWMGEAMEVMEASYGQDED